MFCAFSTTTVACSTSANDTVTLSTPPAPPLLSIAMHNRETLNSLGRLNAMQEKHFKRQCRDGVGVNRGNWMKSKVLSEREKRCLERGWNRRAERANKNFAKRKWYLGHLLKERCG